MVRYLVEQSFTESKKYVEIACVSTDTKPVSGLVTGSLALEVDTGDVYAYNEDAASGSEWGKIAALGGGT